MPDHVIAPVLALISELEQEARRPDLPPTLRRLVTVGILRMTELLEAVRRGNDLLADEIVNGTKHEDGSRRPDGLTSVLPYWARDSTVLRGLAGVVVVDEARQPVTVTVHWERVPPNQRKAAASLASELVDAYRGRLPGGRPRNSRKSSDAKLGDPDTGGSPV